MPLSGMPSFHATAEIIPLSDSDRETEWYLERILTSVAAERPFAQISPDINGVGKSLELEHGRTMEAEAVNIKDASTAAVWRGETQKISTTNYESGLRQEGSIASQIAIDTLPTGGSAGGQTPEAIYWSIGEPLSRLGEKRLGNPFTTLAGLILMPIRAMTSQETADHMLFHFTEVSILCFDQTACLYS